MRAILWLATLLPALALAAPDERDWTRYNGDRVEVTYIDGSTVTGTVIAIEQDQVRLRKDDGSVTMLPMSVVSGVAPAAGPAPESGPPPEPVTDAPKRGPSVGVGLGVGVGMGPVSIGVGGSTGRSGGASGGPSIGGHYRGNIVGVRYPMRGGETVDFLLFDDRGGAAIPPDDLRKSRVMREYLFINEWGQSVPWQTAWAAMGAEGDYIGELKRMDRTLVPMRVAENALVIGGLGLVVWGIVDGMQTGQIEGNHPGLVAGSALGLSSIVFDIAVLGPTRNRMKAELGRKSLERAQDHFAEK